MDNKSYSSLLEPNNAIEWWLDEKVISDIQKRVEDFETGKDKGFSKLDIMNEIQTNLEI